MKKLKVAIAPFNGINYDVEDELRRRGHEVTNTLNLKKDLPKIDVLVTWNEVRQYGNDAVLERAKRRGKGTVLLQHGRRGTSRIYPPFNEELICDKVCVWSENDKQRLMSVGTPENRIFVTGTSVLRYLKPREPHEGINVVFSPEHWGEDVPENAIVAGMLRRMKGVNIITKVIAGEHRLQDYDNPVISDRHTREHFDIVADVLSKADVVVCVSESTFELNAQILDIPVVVADIWKPKALLGDQRYKTYHREYSNACDRVQDMNKLAERIMYAVKHPEYLRKERAEIAIADGGIDIPNPTERICDVIESYDLPKTRRR